MLLIWAAWAGVGFALIVLAVVLRWSYILYKNLQVEPDVTEISVRDLRNPTRLISVIIPAKDEERYVEAAVRSVLASTYHHLQVIVVNDRSCDKTKDILEALAEEDSRICVVNISELPEGWTGKTHAMYQGCQQAVGQVLLFMDADTVVSPDIISKAFSFFHVHDLGMLSLLPGFMERGFSENVVNPHLELGLSTFYPLNEVNDRNSAAALASGSFMMLTRKTYEDLGTWSRFRTEITEDLALSKAAKAQGYKLAVARANTGVRTRKFESVGELRSFWKRTLYGGLEKDVFKLLKISFNYVSLSVLSVCFFVTAAAVLSGKGTLPVQILLVMSSATMAAVVIAYGSFTRNEFGNWLYGLTAPIGILFGVWITLSTLMTVLGDRGIYWRGSRYK